jgi:serine/threonine protein kinase
MGRIINSINNPTMIILSKSNCFEWYQLSNATFQNIKLLGADSFASVYQAKNIRNGEIVCIKEQDHHNNSDILHVFQQKSHILWDLDHPNIVQYFQSFVEKNRYEMIMEYVDGLNLGEYLPKKRPLPEHQALHYFIQLVSTLQYCHWDSCSTSWY